MSRKPTARTVERRLSMAVWEEYIFLREFCIFGSNRLLAHGKKLGSALKRIEDDPEIVNDEDFLFTATQLIEEGQQIQERELFRTRAMMEKSGYSIRG